MRKIRLAIALTAVVLLTVGMTLGVTGWWMSHQVPDWWAPIDPAEPGMREVGQSLETTLVNESHEVRPIRQETWTLKVDETAINAWLATRLPVWIENQGESLSALTKFTDANVDLADDGRVRLGARLGEEGAPVSVIIRPWLNEDGNLIVEADGGAIGRIPVSVGAVFARINGSLAEKYLADDRNTRPITPVFRLGADQNRQMRLVSLELAGDGLTLTWRTEPAG